MNKYNKNAVRLYDYTSATSERERADAISALRSSSYDLFIYLIIYREDFGILRPLPVACFFGGTRIRT